jgi:hypothetical protein
VVIEMSSQQVAETSSGQAKESWSDRLAYASVAQSFKVISTIFFREIRTSGVHQIPTDKPCIFIVAPHANQVSYRVYNYEGRNTVAKVGDIDCLNSPFCLETVCRSGHGNDNVASKILSSYGCIAI